MLERRHHSRRCPCAFICTLVSKVCLACMTPSSIALGPWAQHFCARCTGKTSDALPQQSGSPPVKQSTSTNLAAQQKLDDQTPLNNSKDAVRVAEQGSSAKKSDSKGEGSNRRRDNRVPGVNGAGRVSGGSVSRVFDALGRMQLLPQVRLCSTVHAVQRSGPKRAVSGACNCLQGNKSSGCVHAQAACIQRMLLRLTCSWDSSVMLHHWDAVITSSCQWP